MMNRDVTVGNTLSLLDLPLDILHNILLQSEDIESLGAAAQSCKSLYSIYHDYPSMLRMVLERQIPESLLPTAYALYKCRLEGLARSSMAVKLDLLAKVDGNATFETFFPGSTLSWAPAHNMSAFHCVIQRLTRRAADYSFQMFQFVSKFVAPLGDKYACIDEETRRLSQTETMRFYLAFYRVELYFQLFALSNGSVNGTEFRTDYFRRLKYWEREQALTAWRWLEELALCATPSQEECADHIEWDTDDYLTIIMPDYAISLGLSFVETLLSTKSKRGRRAHIERYAVVCAQRPCLTHSPPATAGLFHDAEEGILPNLANVIRLETPAEKTDPDLGPRNAIFAVYCDAGRYVPDLVSGDVYWWHVELIGLSLVFYCFWDNERIVDADLLPFFATIGRAEVDFGHGKYIENRIFEVDYAADDEDEVDLDSGFD